MPQTNLTSITKHVTAAALPTVTPTAITTGHAAGLPSSMYVSAIYPVFY